MRAGGRGPDMRARNWAPDKRAGDRVPDNANAQMIITIK